MANTTGGAASILSLLAQALQAAGQSPDEPFQTVQEAAALLKVSEETVARQIRTGKIPATRVGRVWRIPSSYVYGLLNSALAAVAEVAS
jgi:excisionase family DNA binding protein